MLCKIIVVFIILIMIFHIKVIARGGNITGWKEEKIKRYN